MNTLEHTISMMEVLPEADLLQIHQLTKKLFRLRNTKTSLNPLNEKDILNDLEISRNQIANKKCEDMGQALEKIREKYGL